MTENRTENDSFVPALDRLNRPHRIMVEELSELEEGADPEDIIAGVVEANIGQVYNQNMRQG